MLLSAEFRTYCAALLRAGEPAPPAPPDLAALQKRFNLPDAETRIVALAYAAGLEPAFARNLDPICGEAQNKPTMAPVLTARLLQAVLPDDARTYRALYAALGPGGLLIRAGILEVAPATTDTVFLDRVFAINDRIAAYLAGDGRPDPRFAPYIIEIETDAMATDPPLTPDALRIAAAWGRGRGPRSVFLEGPPGSGRSRIAAGLARGAGQGLLRLDLALLATDLREDPRQIIAAAGREARLLDRWLYVSGLDTLAGAESNSLRRYLLRVLREHTGPVLIAGSAPADETADAITLRVPKPDATERLALWRAGFNGTGKHLELEPVAAMYQFTAGQIRNAARMATAIATARHADGAVTEAELIEAGQLTSGAQLAGLARKERTTFDWDDLILPAEQTRHLKEICARHREKAGVFDHWGFGKKLPYGRGTHAVFHGTSGTGKTMAAGILARELKLELYRIDLSRVVSKYIGETEKNLARIFAQAENSHAILFFDEADALFGKRTEVKDAHDRYANIETSYLLQEIERYPGISILATNLSENMDKAFLRRMQFVVDFPFPDQTHRRKLWASFIPPEAPIEPDVDFDFLARKINLTGGGIKNIVINAAFYAHAASEAIGMPTYSGLSNASTKKGGSCPCRRISRRIHSRAIMAESKNSSNNQGSGEAGDTRRNNGRAFERRIRTFEVPRPERASETRSEFGQHKTHPQYDAYGRPLPSPPPYKQVIPPGYYLYQGSAESDRYWRDVMQEIKAERDLALQKKTLAVSDPGDPLEMEADRMAQKVMRAPDVAGEEAVQREAIQREAIDKDEKKPPNQGNPRFLGEFDGDAYYLAEDGHIFCVETGELGSPAYDGVDAFFDLLTVGGYTAGKTILGGLFRMAGREAIEEGAKSALRKGLAEILEKAKPTSGLVGRQLEHTLEDGIKVVFRKDFGPNAHPIFPNFSKSVDHYNIEIHVPTRTPGRYKIKKDLHIVVDAAGSIIDIIKK